MKRLTMSLDDELADAFEALVRERGYENRSEAFRDLLRHDLGHRRLERAPEGPCVATLSYVYDHHARQLAMRLTDMQHEHHDLTVATTHVHLNHEQCIETVILRGPTEAVRSFAQSVMAQPGVSHGQLHIVPVEEGGAPAHEHRHGHGSPSGHGHAPRAGAAHPHVHVHAHPAAPAARRAAQPVASARPPRKKR